MTAPARPLEATRHRRASGTTSSRPGGRAAALLHRIRTGVGRELLVFGAIGVVSTAAYALLYLVLRPFTGAVAANAVALLVTAVGNTAANRRLTFRVRDTSRSAVLRDQLAGLAALGVAIAITTGAVAVLAAVAPGAGQLVELGVLVLANAAATVARFVLLRLVVVRSVRPSPVPVRADAA